MSAPLPGASRSSSALAGIRPVWPPASGWPTTRGTSIWSNSTVRSTRCERWVKETPPGFLFDAKVHRLLSRHATRADALPADLRDQVEVTDHGNVVLTPMLEEEMVGRLLDAVEPLERAGKLGALLLQLTPSFAPRVCDLGQLEDLLRLLRGKGRTTRQIVVELRNRGWLEGARRQETVAFFCEQGVTLASIDGPPSEGPKHPAI